jgi:capsule biosynthesis phosphatase
MRICLDIDGVIALLRNEEEEYSDVLPVAGVADSIKRLRQDGHYIILHTARHMRSCQGNEGLVIARQGLTLLAWLKSHDIEYDEIYFGKPYADVYIDDNAYRFIQWSDVLKKVSLGDFG